MTRTVTAVEATSRWSRAADGDLARQARRRLEAGERHGGERSANRKSSRSALLPMSIEPAIAPTSRTVDDADADHHEQPGRCRR
jgi:hypothetical protein